MMTAPPGRRGSCGNSPRQKSDFPDQTMSSYSQADRASRVPRTGGTVRTEYSDPQALGIRPSSSVQPHHPVHPEPVHQAAGRKVNCPHPVTFGGAHHGVGRGVPPIERSHHSDLLRRGRQPGGKPKRDRDESIHDLTLPSSPRRATSTLTVTLEAQARNPGLLRIPPADRKARAFPHPSRAAASPRSSGSPRRVWASGRRPAVRLNPPRTGGPEYGREGLFPTGSLRTPGPRGGAAP